MRAMLSLMFLPFGRANRLVLLAGIGALWLAMPIVVQLWIAVRQMLGIPFFGGQGYFSITMLVSAWVMFCLFANRLHDIGRSALWAVVPILIPVLFLALPAGFRREAMGWTMIITMYAAPLLYFGFAVLLLCFKGKEDPNRFGARPAIA